MGFRKKLRKGDTPRRCFETYEQNFSTDNSAESTQTVLDRFPRLIT